MCVAGLLFLRIAVIGKFRAPLSWHMQYLDWIPILLPD